MHMASSLRRLLGLLLVVSLGCRARPAEKAAPPASGPRAYGVASDLTATLLDPLNIELRWKDDATNEGGYFVEGYFVGAAPSSSEEFLLIDVLPPDTTSYRHTKLLPETRFVYRVRPFFGHPSNVAEVVTGKEGPPQSGVPETHEQAKPRPGEFQTSLKSADTERLAAPTDLHARLVPPAGVQLDWRDHATDEDGYLVEIKAGWSEEFHASMSEAPNTTSVVSYNFPFETKFAFRVRAFVYGEPSKVVEQTTGVDPSMVANRPPVTH